MSNSRSPRAVRSMTMGTRGMAPESRTHDSVRGQAAATVVAQPAEQPLDAAAHLAAVEPQRVGRHVGRRAVDQHRQQREVVGVDPVGGGVEVLGPERRAARRRRGRRRGSPRTAPAARPPCRRCPSAPATRASSSERRLVRLGGVEDHARGVGERASGAGTAPARRRRADAARAARRPGRRRSTSSSPSSAPVATPTGTSPGSVRSSMREAGPDGRL